jgi:hypothetical protein
MTRRSTTRTTKGASVGENAGAMAKSYLSTARRRSAGNSSVETPFSTSSAEPEGLPLVWRHETRSTNITYDVAAILRAVPAIILAICIGASLLKWGPRMLPALAVVGCHAGLSKAMDCISRPAGTGH